MLVPAKGPVSGPLGVCTTATTGRRSSEAYSLRSYSGRKTLQIECLKIGVPRSDLPQESFLHSLCSPVVRRLNRSPLQHQRAPSPDRRPSQSPAARFLVAVANSQYLVQKAFISSYLQIGPASTAIVYPHPESSRLVDKPRAATAASREAYSKGASLSTAHRCS